MASRQRESLVKLVSYYHWKPADLLALTWEQVMLLASWARTPE